MPLRRMDLKVKTVPILILYKILTNYAILQQICIKTVLLTDYDTYPINKKTILEGNAIFFNLHKYFSDKKVFIPFFCIYFDLFVCIKTTP